MTDSKPANPASTSRRDILARGTLAAACAGGCAVALPFLGSLRGTRDAAFATPETVDVDLSSVHEGAQITVTWHGWPVFVQRRSPAMLASLKAPTLLSRLRDPNSKILQQPKDAENWHRSIIPEIGIYIGICTHLGCIPNFNMANGPDTARYLCPCHGSHFDIAGRAFLGAPAPYNLPVPPATLLANQKIRIGASAGDPHFDITAIQQV
ncbi:ubiquinol-cytochrome c reductase iron-sulfur subunit [Neokomagataea thailandica NBRC 106555]|uniref:Ubiquinol-cytochrome c reductase iron-sulfur subunit n=2 Tax=Neokomagataea TaxID=1223423 RepID=A0A4Y6V845_9PROT|nr:MULTISPECIES: ubiquinol-cytochrome c reductase iron-sulfur subunit [Neokomagataea]QDH25514.1 ubiquinol-cytochrome c reductase iron-sulfur subunit [Neokomagataea tanensis]GBR55051.1 ubiquinol-cytochrome c reductase iron-sulfur subunit [Neokomagataea thailandica NBRC 106555]